jgi:hypothetical protein
MVKGIGTGRGSWGAVQEGSTRAQQSTAEGVPFACQQHNLSVIDRYSLPSS